MISRDDLRLNAIKILETAGNHPYFGTEPLFNWVSGDMKMRAFRETIEFLVGLGAFSGRGTDDEFRFDAIILEPEATSILQELKANKVLLPRHEPEAFENEIEELSYQLLKYCVSAEQYELNASELASIGGCTARELAAAACLLDPKAIKTFIADNLVHVTVLPTAIFWLQDMEARRRGGAQLLAQSHLPSVANEAPTGDSGLNRAHTQQENVSTMTQPKLDTVFVVHGRNSKVRDAMFDFLRALGLKPLEFEEAKKRTGQGSPYIGEVLDRAFSDAHAVLVLLTGDDEAQLLSDFRNDRDPEHERKLTPQARPNVLFEAGMAFGRNPERTVLIQFGHLRPFSDVAGRHVVSFDGSAIQRKYLAEHLHGIGCAVELSGGALLTAGAFPPNP